MGATASTICVSMRSTGLSVIMGSWNTIAIRAPRIWRIRALELQEVRSVENNPAADDAAGRVDQAQDREAGHGLAAARLADQAEHLPGRTSKLTPSTARTTPARVKKWVFRSSTSKSGSEPDFGISAIAMGNRP